jgi:hypothetical protein
MVWITSPKKILLKGLSFNQGTDSAFFKEYLNLLGKEGLLDSCDLNQDDVLDTLLSAERIKAFSEHYYTKVKRRAADVLLEWKKLDHYFRKRRVRKWRDPFELLKILIVLSYEAGDSFNKELRPDAVKDQDIVFEALCRLHARSCLIANEVMVLLESGFPDGAHARWRSLHELAAVSILIREHDNELANRYLMHGCVQDYHAMLEYQKWCEQLDYPPYSPEEIEIITRRKEKLEKHYGKEYSNQYGWAAEVLGVKNPKFSQIEEKAGIGHLRPYYKMASDNVHAGPKGVLFKLGMIPQEERDILLAGPSNFGMADPGHGTAISLHQVTTSFLTSRPNLGGLVVLNTMSLLVEDIGREFLRVQKEIENKEAELCET